MVDDIQLVCRQHHGACRWIDVEIAQLVPNPATNHRDWSDDSGNARRGYRQKCALYVVTAKVLWGQGPSSLQFGFLDGPARGDLRKRIGLQMNVLGKNAT